MVVINEFLHVINGRWLIVKKFTEIAKIKIRENFEPIRYAARFQISGVFVF